jgi:GntR family transcriptional regulator / MocR family aminotransferase
MARRRKGGSLARRGDVPLYRQIYDRIQTAIRVGQLRPGDRLPSTRAFAGELSTARGTVEAAYAILAGEGYVVSRGPAGTIVSPELGQGLFAKPTARRRLETRIELQSTGDARPFQIGVPALDAFPRKLWTRLVARQARGLSAADMSYPDPAGYPSLREAIAGYLATARGITCTPREILVTNGYQDALDLIGRVLLRRDDQVWLEDPCYPRTREALEAAGARLQPIGVDAEGMCTSEGIAQARRAVCAVVTPAHQSPLGVTLSLPRRLALLSWASSEDAWIVEDDFDGEFRYVGRPLPALKSLDRDERVLYAGSFSKVLFPGLRLGYLVLPEALVATFTRAIWLRHAGHSVLDQSVVARLIGEGTSRGISSACAACMQRAAERSPMPCLRYSAIALRWMLSPEGCTSSPGSAGVPATLKWRSARRLVDLRCRHCRAAPSRMRAAKGCCSVSPPSRRRMRSAGAANWSA